MTHYERQLKIHMVAAHGFLCGRKGGRIPHSSSDRITCKKCIAAAKKQGISTIPVKTGEAVIDPTSL